MAVIKFKLRLIKLKRHFMFHKISTLPYKRLRHYLSIPFILGMAIPLVLLDICLEIYHHMAFSLYGTPIVPRREYIKIDRQRLTYLGFLDKIWCAYCGYANGLLAYGVKIAGETEKYWCGIKHAPDSNFHEPAHHKDFLPYGDAVAYQEFCKLEKRHEDYLVEEKN